MNTLSPKSINLKSKIRPELLKYPSVKVALKELETLRKNGVRVEILEAVEEDFRMFNSIYDKVQELFKKIQRISIARETIRVEGKVFEENPVNRVIEVERTIAGFTVRIVDKGTISCFSENFEELQKEVSKHYDTIIVYNRNFKLVLEWWLELEPKDEENCVKATAIAELKYPVESIGVLRDVLSIVKALLDYTWGRIDSLQL